MAYGIDYVDIVGAAIQQGAEHLDVGPLTAVTRAERTHCPVIGGVVAESGQGESAVGNSDVLCVGVGIKIRIRAVGNNKA